MIVKVTEPAQISNPLVNANTQSYDEGTQRIIIKSDAKDVGSEGSAFYRSDNSPSEGMSSNQEPISFHCLFLVVG